MITFTTLEAGPERVSVPEHPDLELLAVCQVLRTGAGMWRTLRDAMNAERPFGPAYDAFQSFAGHVWPGFGADDRRDLVARLGRLSPSTSEGRRARAAAALDLHDAMQAENTGHINQAGIVRAVLVEAAGSDPGEPVACPGDDRP